MTNISEITQERAKQGKEKHTSIRKLTIKLNTRILTFQARLQQKHGSIDCTP